MVKERSGLCGMIPVGLVGAQGWRGPTFKVTITDGKMVVDHYIAF